MTRGRSENRVCRMVVSTEEEKPGAWRGGEEGFTERVTFDRFYSPSPVLGSFGPELGSVVTII